MQDLQSEVSDKTKLDNPPKKTAYNLFYKDMREKKNQVEGCHFLPGKRYYIEWMEEG